MLSQDDIAQIVRELELHPTFALGVGQVQPPEDIRTFGSTGNPAYVNLWANKGAAWQVGGFYKDHLSRVHLAGVVTGGTPPSTMTTLPVGYRPASDRVFIVISQTAAAAWQLGVVKITSAGVVSVESGDTNLVSLDGVSYRAR